MTNTISLLEEGISKNIYTAFSISILQNSCSILELSSGLSDPNLNIHVTNDSLFDLASLTKLYVATAFMKLVESGKISQNDKVSKIITSFIGGGKENITYAQILSHSSGLPASFNLFENDAWKKGKDFILEKLISTNLEYSPGTQVKYSCLGYMLLGYAMELSIDLPLDKILDNLIFTPLGIYDITYQPLDKKLNDIVITTYERPNREIYAGIVHDGNSFALGGISGNAGLFGTASSVAKFGQIFLDGSLLKKETISEMISVQSEYENVRRGLGFQLQTKSRFNVGREFSNESFGHTGFTGTLLWIDPQKNLVVSLLTNSVHYYQGNDLSMSKFQTYRNNIIKSILSEL